METTTNHTELVINAVTITCSKRERGNYHAPIHVVNEIKTDWVIDEIRINNVEFTEWCYSIGIPSNWLNLSHCTYKTKKDALTNVIVSMVNIVEATAPEWNWQDETHCPEYFAIVNSLKAGK